MLYGVSIVAYGTQFNFWAALFYVLIIGGIVCVVLVLKKEGIIDQLIAMIPTKTAETVAQIPVAEDVPMFCENCGAKRDADACVCTHCGTKFEN